MSIITVHLCLIIIYISARVISILIQITGNECVTSCTSVVADGTYPSCSRGDKYVDCEDGTKTIKSCINGTIWNQNKGRCVAGTWSVGEYPGSLLCKLFMSNAFICLRNLKCELSWN